ncbi:MAG TPA: RNA polymerase sigma factor [Polyangiaceae bacterium]|nr:RNA polymerase sigma factor [Polyangiaceae bacterium]
MTASASQTHRTIRAIYGIEAPKLVARLARLLRDVGLAEELAQDALVAALENWPGSGIPENPGAWLMATAQRRAIDELRRGRRVEQKHDLLEQELALAQSLAEPDGAADASVGDDLLRLMLISCHPVLPPEGRVALTLRLLGGLTTEEIARAFLVPEPTVAQRIVRAKRTLAERRVPFDLPRGAELTERVGSVLEVLYLIFNEGYSATSGDTWLRPDLCEEALRLGRVLAELAPQEPEVHGCIALLELQASRMAARVDAQGAPILLLDQDRRRWDMLMIRRGLAALARAERLGGVDGPYALQAAIAACHAHATRAEDTDWPKIAALYTRLAERVPSPVVELNRAVAFGMAFGPQAGLHLVDELRKHPALERYHLLPSVRGDLLMKLARYREAREELERAASLTQNVRERALLLSRARECDKLNAK